LSTVLIYTLIGTLAGTILCMIPSLHIYNVMGFALLLYFNFKDLIPFEGMAPLFMSMMVAFAFINTIPMTFLAAADESAGATILPTLDMVMAGRGRDAAILTGMGVFFGGVLLVILSPFFYVVFPYVYKIIRTHLHWVIGLVIVFYVMSEWPKGAGRGDTTWKRFRDGWRNLGAGILTFTLSAIAGIILLTKPLAPADRSFQNIMPIFLGFFAFPSIIQMYLSEFRLPIQHKSRFVNAGWSDFSASLPAGLAGGLMAMTVPAVTIGIAAVFASHFTNHRAIQTTSYQPPKVPGTAVHLHTPEIYWQQERVFVIAGGIMKMMYYIGAFLLMFVLTDITPSGMGRGGLNVLLKPIFTPESGDYAIMCGVILFSSSLSMLALFGLTEVMIWLVPKLNVKILYAFITVLLFGILFFMGGGWMAIAVSLVTTCIGSIPVFFTCRRSHCMAVLLVPIMLSSSGNMDAIARFLGLL